MKLFRAGLLLFIIFFVSGCIKENLDDCPPTANVILTYQLFQRDNPGKDVFKEYISDVIMVVYDEEGNYVTWSRMNKNSLEKFQGGRVNLSPGNYQVICLANVINNTCTDKHHSKEHKVKDGNLTYVTTQADRGVNGDNIFMAPRRPANYRQNSEAPVLYQLKVPPRTIVRDTVDFTPFHRHIEVYIVGFEEEGNIVPKVEMTDLVYGYQFDMEPLRDERNIMRKICLEQLTKRGTTPEGETAMVEFVTSYFNNDNSINLHIKRPSDDETLCTVNMKRFLQDNNINLDDDLLDEDEVTIKILVRFLNGNVTISLANWDNVNVEPEF